MNALILVGFVKKLIEIYVIKRKTTDKDWSMQDLKYDRIVSIDDNRGFVYWTFISDPSPMKYNWSLKCVTKYIQNRMKPYGRM